MTRVLVLAEREVWYAGGFLRGASPEPIHGACPVRREWVQGRLHEWALLMTSFCKMLFEWRLHKIVRMGVY